MKKQALLLAAAFAAFASSGADRAAELLASHPAECPDEMYLDFTRNGNRTRYQARCGQRIENLEALVSLERAERKGRFVAKIAEYLKAYAGTRSWVLPAHDWDLKVFEGREMYADLGAVRICLAVAEALSVCGDRLDSATADLMRAEMRRRVFDPCLKSAAEVKSGGKVSCSGHWWFRTENNWNAVCHSCVVRAALLAFPEGSDERDKLVEAAVDAVPYYMEGFSDDGYCSEGAGYWNMAGGALLDCLGLLEPATGGRMVFWDNEKIRNVLRFPLTVEMGGGWFANFADCDARPFISGERLERAGKKLSDPELAALGIRMRGSVADQLNDTPHLTRALNLLFHAPSEIPPHPEAAASDCWLPDLQVRRVRRGRWMLACKGGHNGENHNHNDVGSFILMQDGEPAVVDAGNMVYTARTFSKDRYSLWNVRAEWHNLPVIGGMSQREGAEHAARNVVCLPDGMALDLEGAYGGEACLQRLHREFFLDSEGLWLTDEGILRCPRDIVWVFLLRRQPVWEPGRITAGNLLIRCPEALTFSLEEKPVKDARMARSWPGSLWRVTLKSEAMKRFHTEFVFTVKER